MSRCLNDSEIGALRRTATPTTWTVLSMALCTGLRASEICALKIRDVKRADGSIRQWIDLPFYKNMKRGAPPVPVYLKRQLRWDIAALCGERPSGAPLFSGRRPGGRLNRHVLWHIVQRACKDAGIDPCRTHDLRHTYITRLAQAGVPMHRVQVLARHSSLQTTSRYCHALPSDLASDVEGAL